MPLTDSAIISTQPGDRIVKLNDGEGLQLHVQPSGSCLWRLAYRFDGKQKALAFGRYPETGFPEARRKRSQAKALLAEGRDPSAERARGKVHAPQAPVEDSGVGRKWTDADTAALAYCMAAPQTKDGYGRDFTNQNLQQAMLLAQSGTPSTRF